MVQRIYHRWEKWECYKAGFFEVHPPKGMTEEECQNKYAIFLKDLKLFEKTAYNVIDNWKNSCEHNLTNTTMNRIAWLGQASMCYLYGIPAKYRGGYHLLSKSEQKQADLIALKVINYWMFLNGYGSYTLETIKSRTQANLY
jgi:hypothetical protein